MELPCGDGSCLTHVPTLFQAVIGDRWHDLPPAVRRLHSVRSVERFSGAATVTRGGSVAGRLAAWLFGFPKPGVDVPLTVTITRTPTGEMWERDFGGRTLRSHLTASDRPYHCQERFGPLTCELELPARDASLHFPVRRGWLVGIPLPAWALPQSISREFEIDGRFHFDVALHAPLRGGLVVRYQGQLRPDAPPPRGSAARRRVHGQACAA